MSTIAVLLIPCVSTQCLINEIVLYLSVNLLAWLKTGLAEEARRIGRWKQGSNWRQCLVWESATVLYWIRGPFIIFHNIHLIMGLDSNCTACDISLKIRYVYIYKGTFGEVPPVSSDQYKHWGECVYRSTIRVLLTPAVYVGFTVNLEFNMSSRNKRTTFPTTNISYFLLHETLWNHDPPPWV